MTSSLPARFIIGIDLGTTNSAAAYVDTQERDPKVRLFPIVQHVAARETEARETLPSFHYTPIPGEFASVRLPWQSEDARHVAGMFARDHGAGVPGRLIVSAKSWLSHSGVDRSADLLPWHGAADVEKLSPTEASARYLKHIRDAWNHQRPDFPMEKQDVVVTIPASFDEIARELTVTAAQKAGLPRVFLLEEPQAAFYAWINASGSEWSRLVKAGQKILVCDVGGGTTDFTLIEAQSDEKNQVRFHRYAVGEHLILGGDNLDVALAHCLEGRISPGRKLDPKQWSVLVRKCQQVKETLLGPSAPESATVHLPSGGSRLIGGALQAEVTREEILRLLVEGFLPLARLEDKPSRRASGFQEFGLPYAPDAAITKYLAAFLTAHRQVLAPTDGGGDSARPDVILFNGGLFESPIMRERLLEVIRSWFNPPGEPELWRPVVLKNERLDLAVAFGAAYYGLVRRGIGVRISGGLAHSYYIGIDAGKGPAALCIAPAGLDEEQEVNLTQRQFDLLIRQPVEFPIFVSSARTTDKAGDLVEIDPTQLTALPPIRTVLRTSKKEAAETIPVHLQVKLTPIGTLEVWCAETSGGRRWKLQFDVRSATQTEMEAHEAQGEQQGFLDEDTVRRCAGLVQKTFAAAAGESLPPERLANALENETQQGRLEWPLAFLRQLWEELLQAEPGRARSVMHEARWLNLLGFALRPGCGVALDDWRVAQTWQIFAKKAAHPGNEMCRAEWWILWRRIAAGLVAGQQRVLAEPLLAALKNRARSDQSKGRSARAAEFRFGQHETEEVWRLLGSLELLAQDLKLEMGAMLLAQIAQKGEAGGGGAPVWALGRIGSRVPLYAPLNAVIPPDAVEPWLDALLNIPQPGPALCFTLMQLSRKTGDRYRDISESARTRVLDALRRGKAPQHLLKLIEHGGALEQEERSREFGEQLPAGLRLRG